MQKCVGHAIEAGFLSPLPLPIGYFKRQLKGKVSALKVIYKLPICRKREVYKQALI